LCLLQVGGATKGKSAGDLIAALISFISGVTPHIPPLDMLGIEFIENFPEVFVENGFTFRGFPTLLFPAFNPFGNTVSQVFAISVRVTGSCCPVAVTSFKAPIAACISMRLFVVAGSASPIS
jgi:hypothetical protein